MTAEIASGEKNFYSIEAPGVLRSNADYNVVVNIFKADEPCEVIIKLFGGEWQLEKSVLVSPLSSETLCFEIPDLCPKEEYFLEATGVKGIEFKKSYNLRFKEGKPLAYIQCDKQAYKRGDNVDYRVIVLDGKKLRPAAVHKPICVKLKLLDNVLKEDKDIQLEHGVFNSQWTIPTEATHGTYDIEVYVGDSMVALKSFQIIDYTASKFNICIKTAEEMLYEDKQMHVQVEASYPDGTPVNGICKLDIESVAGYFSGVFIEKTLRLTAGSTEISIIDLLDDLDIDNSFVEMDWFYTATIMIRATITADNDESHTRETLTTLVTVKKNETAEEPCGGCCPAGDWCDVDSEYDTEDKEEAIKIRVPKKRANIGDMLDFSIVLGKPTKFCIYFIIARGNIIKSELINIEDHSKSIERNLEITFEHVPRAFILAYYIHEGVLYFDEVGFNLAKKFENKLEINLPENATPGTSIPIEIKSAPNSLVALMAVEENSILLNAKNDLKYEQFFTDLHHIRSQTPKVGGAGCYAGLMPGLLTITNAKIDGFDTDIEDDGFCRLMDHEHFKIESRMPRIDTEAKKKDIKRALQERNQVFGNLVFANKQTNADGLLNFELNLPEKQSIWVLTVLAISNEKGFVMTKEPLKINAKPAETPIDSNKKFKPFITQTLVTEFVVDHYENEISNHTLNIEKPDNGEPVELTFSILENLYGPLIADLTEYAGIMYCTSYLQMTTMIPNINVLEYLEHFNQLDSDFAISIKKRFPEAIERELSERRNDNSFCWFSRDPKGSPHVTAIVLQAFQRAAKYVEIDPAIIESGLEYLASQQMESGEITKETEPYKYPFEPDVGVGLTSIVLLAFLQNEETKQKYQNLIDKAFNYIIAHIEPIKCVYDLALAFYAMQLAKHSYAQTLKERLFQIANVDVEKNHKWWSYSVLPNEDPNTYYPISDLEVTSYVLLGLLETETIETMLPIIKWMLPLRGIGNETMDCAVALNAALKMAIKSGAALGIINVEYKAIHSDGEYSGQIILTPENATRIQTHVLPQNTERIEFSVKEKGTFFGKLVYRYKEGQ